MSENISSLTITVVAVLIVICCIGVWQAFNKPDKRNESDSEPADVLDALEMLADCIDFDD